MPIAHVYPTQVVSSDGGWVQTGGNGFLWDAIDDPAGSPDDFTTFINHQNTGAMPSIIVKGVMPLGVVAVNSIKLAFRTWEGGAAWGGGSQEVYFSSSTLGISNGPYTVGLPAFNTPTSYSNTWTNNPLTNKAWLPADLEGLAFAYTTTIQPPVGGNKSIAVTQFYMDIDYVGAPSQLIAAQLAGGMLLRLFRKPLPILKVKAPIEYARFEIGTVIALSGQMIADWSGSGAGLAPWHTRLYYVTASELDLDALDVKLTLVDVRYTKYLIKAWDTMLTDQPPSITADGTARLDVGLTRSYTRASVAYIEDPSAFAGKGIKVVLVQNDQELLAPQGELFEAASSGNQIAQSSFQGGVGSPWVTSGTGVNGSAITADPNQTPLFDKSITVNSCRMTAGNPLPAADLIITGALFNVSTGGTGFAVSIDRMDAFLSFAYFTVQRSDNNQWWTAATNTWGAAKAYNPMPLQPNVPARYTSPIGTLTAGANTALNVSVVIPGSGASTPGLAGQINNIYDVQLEFVGGASPIPAVYPTSRMVNGSNHPVARAASKLLISNNVGLWSWHPDHGTFSWQVSTEWNSADLVAQNAGQTRYLINMTWDATNYWDRLYFDPGLNGGSIVFERKFAGTLYQASQVVAIVAGTFYNVVARWVGILGELGLAPYTLSLFWNGTRSDVLAGGAPTSIVPATANVEVGSLNATQNWDGFCKNFELVEFVKWDSEALDYP
jgi:hypothetical protein